MKTIRKAFVSVLALCLLLAAPACQDHSDEVYSRAMAEGASAAKPESSSAAPESSGSSAAGKAEPPANGTGEKYSLKDRDNPEVNYLEKRPKGGEMFDIEPNTELSGELTISVFFLEERLVHWTEAFEAAYPNVKITINAGFKSDAAAEAAAAGKSVEDVTQQRIVDLFAGEAGDIVDLFVSPYRRYYKSGLFYDLHEFMDSDPDFREEDYYTGILKAWETEDGALPVLGTCVDPTAFAFNTLVLDEMGIDLKKEYPDGMNYEEIADLFYRAKDRGALAKGAVLGHYLHPASFEDYELSNYVDETHGTADFDSPGYVKYLETMKALPLENPVYTYVESQYPFFDRTDLVQHSSIQFSIVDRLAYGTEKENLVYQTYRIRDGGTLFFGRDMYGITKACKDPQLAWEFVKFVASEKDFPERLNLNGQNDRMYHQQYFYGFPVNRANLKKLCDSYYYSDQAVYEAADRLMESLNVPRFQDGELMTALEEIHKDYFERDLITAEECAKQLQERAWMYFHE